MKETLFILLEGQIQGVGFRPFVSHLAQSLELVGYVQNLGYGVEICLQGKQKEDFLKLLPLKLPSLASITSIQTRIKQCPPFQTFEILKSQNSSLIRIPPIPDFAICQECQKEILNHSQRRYFYPLINCTNCGPRFSVIRDFPYDRERTSMQPFEMCQECQEQYSNPQSRFFHAQPISCPKCSPSMFWMGKEVRDFVKTFQEMADVINNGEIVCIQGIGGFHWVCNAKNKEAVLKLRKLKMRPKKPLAIMCKDTDEAKKIAYLSPKEEEILNSKESPIVLLEPKVKLPYVALDRIGVVLAYTPIYKLLFEFLDNPLIVTSANFSGEGIAYKYEQVKTFAIPYIFSHQREILHPIEDSVVQVLSTQDMVMLRSARGYAPKSFKIDKRITKPLLALGANQKASFAFAFEDLVILSPYIGNLSKLAIFERFKETLGAMQNLYSLEFSDVICDLHPNYESTKLAHSLTASPVQIQHHYAHTLSVCFEHSIQHKVLSFCFDGTGYGEDGAIWGGEVLLADPWSFERILHFRYFPLLGGEVAIKKIQRSFFALLGDQIPYDERLDFFVQRGQRREEIELLEKMRKQSLNSPLTSSVGRIFDAIAWICGLLEQDYEGESGELIQSLYDEHVLESYGFSIIQNEIVLDILEIYQDSQRLISPRIIASKFLNTLIEIITKIANHYSYDIVLCGGVFCNKILSAKLLERLKTQRCFIGKEIPPNDNGIAVGQLYYLLQRRENAR